MSAEALQVTKHHLRELAATHQRAAAEMTVATAVVADIAAQLRISHGTVGSAAADALLRIQQYRHTAGSEAAAVSRRMSDDLLVAADQYAATDYAAGWLPV